MDYAVLGREHTGCAAALTTESAPASASARVRTMVRFRVRWMH